MLSWVIPDNKSKEEKDSKFKNEEEEEIEELYL